MEMSYWLHDTLHRQEAESKHQCANYRFGLLYNLDGTFVLIKQYTGLPLDGIKILNISVNGSPWGYGLVRWLKAESACGLPRHYLKRVKQF